MNTKSHQFLYLQIADRLEKQILDEVLKAGDKLPSVRMVCREQGLSMSTVTQAYYELESRSLIETRPRSGYYVCLPPVKRLAVPQTSNPSATDGLLPPDDLVSQVYMDREDPANTLFSLGMPHDDFLPIARLNKGLIQAMRNLPASGTGYEPTQGNENLRREIAKWSFGWGADFTEKDLITTSGCMNAISYALLALTKPGDTIAIESPAYFGILQLAKSAGLQVLELPTNAITGIELDALKKALSTNKIKVCLFVSNFNNPCGSSMPDEHKRAAVKLLEHYHVPLIEDDIHGDLYFSNNRPTTCKTYDESGLVLYCNSVSKTLAPGYRVGWIAPGKFKDQVIKLKRYHAISSAPLTSEVVAIFLKNGRYENHLRKLRQTLYHNSMKYIGAIANYFPEGVRVSQPQGGYFLWLELDKSVDTAELYHQAMKHQISIAPGRMFTLQPQFDHCMRLSFGLPWTAQLEKDLQQLGKLVKAMQKSTI
ncbi:PLP-dependent aminotransferase family protein [Pedobacter steynii]|uniref:GntR family transcriptional regulator n=1 Tax=Pedobacter steynii TaxID=430522 RepID=A0A1D7QIY0_9SPHI|nr:PLP-dependent aminotransferase family protein [Pedobacter steynii]AOM78632.1 GntR family transcriptional regulator [Pedobacter steynii]